MPSEAGPSGPWSTPPPGSPPGPWSGPPSGPWSGPPAGPLPHPPAGPPGWPDDGPQRTSPVTAGLALAGLAVGLLLLVGEAAFLGSTGSGEEPGWVGVVVPLAIVAGTGREVLGWWARTYRVGADRLVVDEGVLTRHHRVVPFERVQQVDVNQTLVQQVLGLAALRIDTAGEGGTTTVSLRLLDRRRADALRDHVLSRRAELQAARAVAVGPGAGPPATAALGPTPAPAPPPPPVELLVLSPGRLAVAALAGPSAVVGALALVLGGLAAVTVALRSDGAAAGAAVLAGSVALVAVVAALAVAAQVVSLWGLRVDRVGDDLRLRMGLLEVRDLTIPRRRVQVVRITDNPLQRALGLVAVTLLSASAGSAQGNQAPTSFTIPSVARRDLDATLGRLLGGTGGAPPAAWSVPALARRGSRARGRGVRRRVAALAVLGTVALLAGPSGLLVVLVAGACGWLWGLAAHERAGWAVGDTTVALARGVLVHHVDLVPLERVQSARTTAGALQRRAGLATLHVDVAGGARPHLWDLEAPVAEELRRALPRAGARHPGVQPP